MVGSGGDLASSSLAVDNSRQTMDYRLQTVVEAMKR